MRKIAQSVLVLSALAGAATASPISGARQLTFKGARSGEGYYSADEMADRLTGTDGERRATAYVADAFEALGLTPAGDDGTMFQSFDFTAGVALADGNSLSISVNGVAETIALEDAWRPLAFSRTEPAAAKWFETARGRVPSHHEGE